MNYLSLNNYLRETFGTKVYKLSLDGGFTCPNRDGSLGVSGCIFCSGFGSGDFAASRDLSITEQIESAKSLISKKVKPVSDKHIDGKIYPKYIAYFQAFTNTYAPVDVLRAKFIEAINHKDIVAISIATRPDCLPDEVLDLISELNKIKPVWVELGLQTVHEKSSDFIRRGYPLSVYDKAMTMLKSRNIYTVTHVILGLPYETEEMMLETVKYACDMGTDGIKLQLLHIIKGTDLADLYLNNSLNGYECMTLDEYCKLICKCLSIIPENIAIHRMTGDGSKKTLIAPLWSADKKRVLNTLSGYIRNTP